MSKAKAFAGALSVFLGSLVTAMGDNVISPQEWMTAVGLALGGFGIVHQVTNKPKQ